MTHHDFSKLLKPTHRNPLIADKGRSQQGNFIHKKISEIKVSSVTVRNSNESDILELENNEEVKNLKIDFESQLDLGLRGTKGPIVELLGTNLNQVMP